MIPIKGTDFARDENNNALINTNVSAYLQYKHRRQQNQIQNQQDKEIASLKNEIADLKLMIAKILESKNV